MQIRNVAVFCASSTKCHSDYLNGAEQLGKLLAKDGFVILYGGGKIGVMGRLADGAISLGGKVTGVIPRFMIDLEWGHQGCTELRIVDGMSERVQTFMKEADAFVILPGGSGTFDELFQALSWKRLGLLTGPIVIVNLRGYFDPCLELLDRSIRERFMDPRHRKMWSVVESVDQVPEALRTAPSWDPSAIDFATV